VTEEEAVDVDIEIRNGKPGRVEPVVELSVVRPNGARRSSDNGRSKRGAVGSKLRTRQRVGKYRIEGKLGSGGFARVYQAMDTIEGVRVALKVPHAQLVTEEVLKDFRHEVRITAKLDHPNILPLKDASVIDGHFVLTYPLGERSLSDRLQKRIGVPTALYYAEQMLEALAYAHGQRIVHCDVKPDNMILFKDQRIRLADFGIAKVAQKTLKGRGTGTVGHMAPEQAMGKPTMRSDVFSMGLIIYRMLTGQWPEWPYEWPFPGHERLKGRVHPDMIRFLQRATEVSQRKRFRDGDQMLDAFLKAQRATELYLARRR
jgi:serine/threonine-protein kinase